MSVEYKEKLSENWLKSIPLMREACRKVNRRSGTHGVLLRRFFCATAWHQPATPRGWTMFAFQEGNLFLDWLLAWVVLGIAAGYITAFSLKGGYGILVDLLAGLLGGLFGGFLFGILPTGLAGHWSVVCAAVGAGGLIALGRIVARARS